MCGFVYSNFIPEKLSLEDITPRGPDDNNTIINDLGYFYHCRLTTRENNIKQPSTNSNGVLLYNGTEYYMDSNDTIYINNNLCNNITKNIEFIRSLDGDFAICYVTEENIFLAKDCFGTKPLFYGIKNSQIIIASTESTILSFGFKPFQVDPNTVMIFSRSNAKYLNKFTIINWDITQGITTLDDVFEAFECSVLSRYEKPVLLNLSSGHDSGAIAACLNKHNKKYSIITLKHNENAEILIQRTKLHKGKKKIITLDSFEKNKIRKDLLPWKNFLNYSYALTDISLCGADEAKKNNIKVILTGTGGDELYSDYGFNGHRLFNFSVFGGYFPEDFSIISPHYTNKIYPLWLNMPAVEYVYAFHGIDTRHPLLDKKLFQKWMNTSTHEKNANYKNWLCEYFKQLNYPYDPDYKVGAGNIPLKIPKLTETE